MDSPVLFFLLLHLTFLLLLANAAGDQGREYCCLSALLVLALVVMVRGERGKHRSKQGRAAWLRVLPIAVQQPDVKRAQVEL
jgi:hypothetical protein